MLTGILSRRNTASHRCVTRLRALPLSPPTCCGFSFPPFQRIKIQEAPNASCKKSKPMTSYGGIIRIRLWVEVDDFLSACRYKLPCILLQAHYTRFIRKMQALPWEGGRGAAFVLVFWKKHGTIRVRTAFPGKAERWDGYVNCGKTEQSGSVRDLKRHCHWVCLPGIQKGRKEKGGK